MKVECQNKGLVFVLKTGKISVLISIHSFAIISEQNESLDVLKTSFNRCTHDGLSGYMLGDLIFPRPSQQLKMIS